jgi:uncharacterized membrane protein YedE/YeeE
MNAIAAFFAGLIFAIGLGAGGMTQPAKVLAFLDVAGNWDPSLAFVMAGAIAVYAPVARWALRRPAPLCTERFQVPARRDLDAALVGGAVLFGIGWGLAGYCPGPAVVSLASASSGTVLFVAAMLVGMTLERLRR